MTTQILNLPFITMTVATSTQSDWRTDIAITSDVPLDLTGIEFTVRVWRTAGGNEVMLSASSTGGEITISGGNNALLRLVVLVARMRRIPIGTWPMDILAEADGVTLQLAAGEIDHSMTGGSMVTSIGAVKREASAVVV